MKKPGCLTAGPHSHHTGSRRHTYAISDPCLSSMFWLDLNLSLSDQFEVEKQVRVRVLLDMAFNLGIVGLLAFKRTLAAVEAGQYQQAATMMLDSKWAKQVGGRAERLSRMMMTGKTPRELWPQT